MATDHELRSELSLRQLEARLGLAGWQVRLAREHGLLPEPDRDGRWSARLAERCREQTSTIIDTFGTEPPIGAGKAAMLLAARVRLDVERADVEVLVAQGALDVVSRFQQYPVYLVTDVMALDAERVAAVVAARKGPLLERVEAKGAAHILGWPKRVFDRIAAERGLRTDQLSRYALDDVRALADDADLAARIHAERREQALARARRNEQRHAQALRDLLAHCHAYLDQTTATPPDPATVARTLRALRAARATVASEAA